MYDNGMNIRLQKALKRIIDIVGSALGLIICSPFLVMFALMIKLDSPGRAIYRQQRIGKDGIPFDLYKFRTMVKDCDDIGYTQYLHKLIESECNGSKQPLPYRKMDSDSRVTRVGQFLRRYYLDELPQLWNVLKGDMSLVGPRPHVQLEVDHYTREQRRRLTVKPGITGFWQVAGKANCTFSELIAMDLEYINSWNLKLDLEFIIKTLHAMLHGGEEFLGDFAEYLPLNQNPIHSSRTPKEPPVYLDTGD